jgi:queuosine biosynthesis protein QueD
MSKVFNVTKSIEFDYGHRVPNHKSKCYNVHGHRGRLAVTVQGPLVAEEGASDEGMVMDFADIKSALTTVAELFDHRFIMWRNDPLKKLLLRGAGVTACIANAYIIGTDGDGLTIEAGELGPWYCIPEFGIVQELDRIPTAENIAYYCYQLLKDCLPGLVSVAFWETPNSWAVYEEGV